MVQAMMRIVVVAIGVLLAAGPGAIAQLGADEAGCMRQWGAPVSTEDLNADVRVLTFGTNDLVVQASFLGGVVQRIAYRKPTFTDGDIQKLLQLNTGGVTWALWRHTETEQGVRQDVWIRSDEMAMGVFEAGMLTISSGAWNQYAARVSTAEHAPAAASPAINPAADVQGVWQADTEHGGAAIEFKPDGTLQWIAFEEGDQREFRGRYQVLDPGHPMRVEIWRAARDREPLGLAVLQDDRTITFGLRQTTAEKPTGFWPIDAGATLVYRPVAQLPEWDVAEPAQYPKAGDTRDRVLKAFGKPKGTLSTGSQEFLSYPWGQVTLEKGVVTKTKPVASAP